MPHDLLTSFIAAAEGLAPQVAEFADEGERSRRLPLPLVEAMARAGLFGLWMPHALGGPEVRLGPPGQEAQVMATTWYR